MSLDRNAKQTIAQHQRPQNVLSQAHSSTPYIPKNIFRCLFAAAQIIIFLLYLVCYHRVL